VLRVAELPISEEAQQTPREQYLLDSAHHGIAMNPAGTKLCVAGTMSDYAAIVSRATFDHRIAAHGVKPYWSTNSGDGRYCFISFSGDDRVSVVSYAQEREIASIPVGDHPQRMRMGVMRSEFLPADTVAPRIRGARVVRAGGRRSRRRALRVRLSEPSILRVVVTRRAARRDRVRRSRARARRWVPVRRRRPVARRGLTRVPLGRFRAGRRYRVVMRATDDAGNVSKRRVARFRVRRAR
jgi:hypothetical protein